MTAINPTSSDRDERAPRQRRPAVRWGLLLAATGLVPLIVYFGVAAVIAAAAVTAEGGRDSLGAALVAALPGWLAAFQVPLSIQQAPLSALPLLPTLAVATLIGKASAHVVRRSRVRRPEQGLWVILVMAFGHALFGTAMALLVARLPIPVDVAPGDAFAYCGSLAAVSATLGVVHRCGLLYLVWERVPEPVWWGLNRGARAAAAIAGVGGVVLVGALCLSVPELLVRSAQAGSGGAVFGGVVLSLLYLPDALVAAWAYVAGTGVSLGQFGFGVLGEPPQVEVLPTVPLFGLLPDASLARWWSVLLVLPVAVGVFLGWSCRTAHPEPRRRLSVVATAAAVAAVLVLVAALVVGGRLGGGGLDPVSARPLLLTAATFGWLVVPAGVTAWFAGPRAQPRDPETDGVHDEPEVPGEAVVDETDEVDEVDEADEAEEVEEYDEAELPEEPDEAVDDVEPEDIEPEDVEPEVEEPEVEEPEVREPGDEDGTPAPTRSDDESVRERGTVESDLSGDGESGEHTAG